MHNTRYTIAAGGMDQGLQPLEFSELAARAEALAPCALDFFVMESPAPTGLIVLLCIETTGTASLLL